MKRALVRLGMIVAVVFAVGFSLTRAFPERSAAVMIAGLRMSAGLEAKVVETSLGPIHYLEGGEGETIVFIHGIYARKEHWIDLSRALTGNYRVLLLDLPGFGDNQVLGAGAYDLAQQQANLIVVLDALDIDSAHIAANSMGAQVAGMIATDTPERVQSIAFIGSPLGVASPTQSEMEIALENGAFPLVVTSEREFEDRMDWLFPKPPFMPAAVLTTWARAESVNAIDNRRIWDEVHKYNGVWLGALAPQITQPAFVIWCREDRIFHFSGATVLEAALPNGQLAAVANCGHVPMLDKPAEVGALFANFLKGAD